MTAAFKAEFELIKISVEEITVYIVVITMQIKQEFKRAKLLVIYEFMVWKSKGRVCLREINQTLKDLKNKGKEKNQTNKGPSLG